MMQRPWLGVLLILVIAVSVSCWSKRKPGADRFPPIQVHVENQNFYDATIYLQWSGSRRRLGVTGGHETESFTAAWIGPDVTFEVALLAGQTYRGDKIGVSPGDELVVVIPVDPARFHVYHRAP